MRLFFLFDIKYQNVNIFRPTKRFLEISKRNSLCIKLSLESRDIFRGPWLKLLFFRIMAHEYYICKLFKRFDAKCLP